MTTDSKAKKAADVKFLSDEQRENLLETLEDMGIVGEELSDADLVKKIQSTLTETHDKLVQTSAQTIVRSLGQYLEGTQIRNKEFAERLMNLSIPKIYLLENVFTDEDMKLTDKQLWLKVRQSRVNPIKDSKSIFIDRTPKPEVRPVMHL